LRDGLLQSNQEHLCYSKRARFDEYQVPLDLNCVHQQGYNPPTLARKSATEGVTSLNNEANSIDLSLLLPQQNTSMIDKERSNDLTARSENSMGITNTHKSKTNVAITHISTMVDMTNFSSLCINCNTIISAILNSTRLQPLYCQILLKFISLLNNPDFDAWYAVTKGSMPSLHWHVYTPFLNKSSTSLPSLQQILVTSTS
jgi:hypothetical protein